MKTHLKSCRRQFKGNPIYKPPKSSHWGPNQQLTLLSVDRRSTANGQIFDRWEKRSTERSTENWALTYRSTARSIGAIYREQELSGGRSCGRPALGCARGRPTSGSVDRSVDRQTDWSANVKGLKLGVFTFNKIP